MINENENTIYIMCDCTTPEDAKMEIINESSIETTGGKKVDTVTIDTCLQSFEVSNWNNRIYGRDVVQNAIDNDGMIQNDIKHGQWVGEYGHPLDTDPKRQVVFDPMRCSHRILNYRFEGNLLNAHVQTLAGGAGDMLCNRIRQGMPAAFSLRSLGSIDLATRRVKAPLKVLTYDSVIRPSHIEAYQKDIISEAVEINESFGNTEFDIITESADMFVPIKENIAEIESLISSRSENVAKIAEMFHLDKMNISLCEDATRMDIILEDGTRINAPVDSVLRMQYADVLNANKHRLRGLK